MADYSEFSFLSEPDKVKFKVFEHDVFQESQSGKVFMQSAEKMEKFLDDVQEKYPLSKKREEFLHSSYIRMAHEYRLWIERDVYEIEDKRLDNKAFSNSYKHARNLLVFCDKQLQETSDRDQKKRLFNKMLVLCPKEKDEDLMKLGEILMHLGDFMKPVEKVKLKDFRKSGTIEYDKDDIYILSAHYSSLAYDMGRENGPAYQQMQEALNKIKKQSKIDDYMKKTINVRLGEFVDVWKERLAQR